MNPLELAYDKLLHSFEALLPVEEAAITNQDFDNLSPLEDQKNRILQDLVQLGKSLDPSPKKHPKFKKRIQAVLSKQSKNLSLLEDEVEINRLATKKAGFKRTRATAVHQTYKHSVKVKNTTTSPSDRFLA